MAASKTLDPERGSGISDLNFILVEFK